METKIPPPIVTFLFGLSIYFSRGIFQAVEIKHSFYIGILLLILGLAVLISAVRLFRKDETTVNPLSPEQATKLVTDGIFKYSRNPMYLGLTSILLSSAIYFSSLFGVIIYVPLFIFFITIFQIIPEEEAMRELFKDKYKDYCSNVRRWI